GSGDACQPFLSIGEIRKQSPSTLVAAVHVGDPQNDPLSGNVNIHATAGTTRRLDDFGILPHCDNALYPKRQGEGIAFANGSIGFPVLFDVVTFAGSFGASCGGVQRFWMQPGTCDHPTGNASETLNLSGMTPPIDFCLFPAPYPGPTYDVRVVDFDL